MGAPRQGIGLPGVDGGELALFQHRRRRLVDRRRRAVATAAAAAARASSICLPGFFCRRPVLRLERRGKSPAGVAHGVAPRVLDRARDPRLRGELHGFLPLRRGLGSCFLLCGLLLGRLLDLDGAEPLAFHRGAVPCFRGGEGLFQRHEVDAVVAGRDGAKGPVLGGAVGGEVLALFGEDEAGVRDVLFVCVFFFFGGGGGSGG